MLQPKQKLSKKTNILICNNTLGHYQSRQFLPSLQSAGNVATAQARRISVRSGLFD
jgi:hypothetical protein